MEKPLSARLHERMFGGSPLSTGLDAALVAESFGVSYPVGESLPESSIPIKHVEDDQGSGLIIDRVARPKPKPVPQSLFAIVTGRLKSIKTTNPVRARDVSKALADLQERLVAADELVAVLQSERREELQKTWEALQNEGRALKRKIENEFTAAVNTSWMEWNAAEQKRAHAKGTLGQRFQNRRAIKLDRYSTTQQIADANRGFAAAEKALAVAQGEHLAAERNKAEAENKKALASSRLRGIEIAMDRIVAEQNDVPYHDQNNFGLSTATPTLPAQ